MNANGVEEPFGLRSADVEAPATARGSLGRQVIINEAMRFIDERGINQLTMRRLGAELGVEAMALYRYVPSRQDLLDGVVQCVLDEYVDPDELPAPSWQHYLQKVAHGVRNVALGHPNIFPLVATRPPEAPWLRPPLRSLAWVESFLARLSTYGFDDEGLVAIYRAFSSFLLGHLLLEVSAGGGELGSAMEEPPEPASLDLSDYPRVERLAPRLAEDAFADEFEDSLENLLDRLGRLLPHEV